MEQKETVLSAVEQAKEKMNALLEDVSRFESHQFDAKCQSIVEQIA